MSCNSAPGNLSVTVLLDWGYLVSVESGRLIINPNNNIRVAKHLSNAHELKLMVEILQKMGRDALTYLSYSASKYGKTRAGGVALQFTHVLTGAEAYAIFNADLTRSRNTKHGRAGDPLSEGQFHLAKGSSLCKLWASTGLPSRRLSSYYEHMGNLKQFFFEPQDIYASKNRLSSSSLKPLNISAYEVKEAFELTDSAPTTDRQCTDKRPTVTTDKEPLQPSETLGLQNDSTAGADYCGKTVIRKKVIRENTYPIDALNSDPINTPYVSKPKHKFDDSSLWFKPLGVPKLKL